MSTENNQLAVAQAPAFLAVAGLTGLDAKYLVETVKKQCFKGAATDEQVDAFISIACEMKVNPLLPGMLYAYPIAGGGIVPIMGPSGVYKKLVEHPEVASWETEVFPTDVTVPPTHAVTKIWRKGVERPLQYTALLSEWKIESNPNWRTRPRHMLALRALKHCANQIIHGIPYDEDDRAIMAMQNVTGTGQEQDNSSEEKQEVIQRPQPKERAKRGVAAAKAAEVVVLFEPAAPAPADDIQQAMKEREAKTQSQGGDDNAVNPRGAHQANQSGSVTPQVPSNPAPAATAPRNSINEGETITANVTVDLVEIAVGKLNGVQASAVKATVSGDYNGVVRDAKGATLSADQKSATPNKPWEKGAKLTLKLLGKMSSAPAGQALHKQVIAWAQDVAVTQTEEME